MVDIGVVLDKLQSFETADNLADFFRGYGIKAQPRDARMCPISKFVEMETGISPVTNMSSVTFYKDEFEMEMNTSYPHTPAMKTFVDSYDRGYYPDLIEAGYEINGTNYCCEACDGY